MRLFLAIFFSLLFTVTEAQINELPTNNYEQEFAFAYSQYPNVPRGLLEGVSFTMTRFQHLQNQIESCSGLPKTYGVMGLTLDGKNYFNNKTKTDFINLSKQYRSQD